MPKTILSKFSSIKLIVVAGLILLAASMAAYWHFVYTNPTHVFDRMLATSLSTSSVTKKIIQGDASQGLDQTAVLVTEPIQQVHSASILTQVSDVQTKVTTESIGTPPADFVRYNDIKTSQKNAAGQTFDFSSILGIWGKVDQNDTDNGGAQLYNQTLLGVIPMANVAQPDRKQLVNQIKENGVYKIDGAVKRQFKNGRLVYSYNVTVAPVAYVTLLKSFAHDVGITQLEELDPSQYAGSQPLKFTFDIDVWSNQLIKVTFADSARTETYGSYGARMQVALPVKTIPIGDLQNRLQQIH